MSAFSDYLENALLDHTLGNTAFTQPTVYVALFTDTATAGELEAGTLTNEVAGGSYARQGPVAFDAAASGATANTNQIDFTDMPAVTVAFAAVVDSATEGAGNVLYHGALSANKTLNSGDTFTINAGDLDITLD